MSAAGFRCSDTARERHDSLIATAVPARRFLLVEVPGPWPRRPLGKSHLDPGVADLLGSAAGVAGARLQLIRRPGRHADPDHATTHPAGLSWALADVRPGVETVRWGRYHDDTELLSIDLDAELDPVADRAGGPQRVALICTHGTRDVCCAVRGRPVAHAAAALPGWDVWETTHVGGDRFAANMIVLPTGDMFGHLDPQSITAVLEAYSGARLLTGHHRGRCGTQVLDQAASALVAQVLADDRQGAVLVGPTRDVPGDPLAGRNLLQRGAPPDRLWDVAVVHAGIGYVARISAGWGPQAQLSCSGGATRARRYELDSLSRIRPERLVSAAEGH